MAFLTSGGGYTNAWIFYSGLTDEVLYVYITWHYYRHPGDAECNQCIVISIKLSNICDKSAFSLISWKRKLVFHWSNPEGLGTFLGFTTTLT